MKKWWIYQKERFPLAQYIPMIIVFTVSGISYSYRLSHRASPSPAQYVVGIFITLIWFMLLRIADEHKDYEEDKKYRPYRAVPRGLITLMELKYLGIILVLIQIGLTFWLDIRLLPILLIVYAWFALMSFEFGVADWLKQQHTLYLLSHMVMMLLINFYITSIEWISHGFLIELVPYLLAGYATGLVLEVGRKLRSEEEEEEGVATYTAVWGVKKSVIVWLVCVAASLIAVIISAYIIESSRTILAIFAPLYLIAIYFSTKFIKVPAKKNAKFFKIFPAIWFLFVYLALGVTSWI
ncbi:MAG: UbiA family prenyltransferase [Defluviitaleaceae bacterium]|nr:UbiA family prenyltransferase [Defluviitaleaceae bacterium]